MSLEIPGFLAPRLTKPVAIFGAGVSGEGVRLLLGSIGAEGVVYDAKGTGFGEAAARRHALVVFSPGFAPEHPWLALARAAGAECLGELDFASLFWRGRVVAITGTNGKTTLTEFLTHALGSVGREARATGNIGHPFSRLVVELDGGRPTATAVCEVSSFQSETLRHLAPDATLWTNLAEDHLERHPGLKAYFTAKWKLVERTRGGAGAGSAFLGSSVMPVAREFGASSPAVVAVPTLALAPDPKLAGTVFAEYPQRENFVLAQAWWRTEGLGDEPLYAAARAFELGRHRLTRVAEIRGVTYWNDSKGTNFHAVEAALARFSTPVVLIAGGKPKGGDLAGFIRRIAAHVHHVALIGATSEELARACVAFGVSHSTCGTLAAAVRRAAEIAPRGGQVLLSPGFASFDQFRNYEDRGEQFEKLVRELALESADPQGAASTNLR